MMSLMDMLVMVVMMLMAANVAIVTNAICCLRCLAVIPPSARFASIGLPLLCFIFMTTKITAEEDSTMSELLRVTRTGGIVVFSMRPPGCNRGACNPATPTSSSALGRLHM